MKQFIVLFISIFIFSISYSQDSTHLKIDPNKKVLEVEAACGQCKFGLPGKSCDLAVRIDGKAYFVDGTHIDKHGDAHASDGFCNAIRKAKVQGEIVKDRFKATWFELAPEKKTNTKDN